MTLFSKPNRRNARRRGAFTAVRATAALAVVALGTALAVIPVARVLGYEALVVRSGSMGEAIPVGSLVVARSLAASEVRVGHVILLRDGQAAPKLHRVTSRAADHGKVVVRTRGDANRAADPNPYVLPPRLLTPVHHLPYLGFLVGGLTAPLGWLFLVALPSVVLTLLMLRSIWAVPAGAESERPVAT